jgi:Tfp pilus assembly protein PilF
VEQSGDPEAAARLLAKRLEDPSMAVIEKARIHTQLAALSRAAGVEPAAERHLLEALTHDPGHVGAIVALADFYAERDRDQDLTDFLRDVIAEQTVEGEHRQPPTVFVAELHRRLASAYEKLGRDEDAYQTLLAADKLARGHLLIKLALGENRYKARRWREAALHLAPLAGHDEAPKYAQEVAQGLYHAALAEIRSLRPERASALYTRALELRPSFAPALQAMAEIAMEQGDAKRASELLTRQAQATDDAAERLRLYEALGDMALMMLRDELEARQAYSAAVASANPLEARHLPLLEKLLERQDYAADFAGSARTAELMAAFGANHAARASRLLRAAKDYVAAGDIASARAVADRANSDDPTDLEAVDVASGLAMTHGDAEHAATILGRTLAGKGDNDPTLRATLWHRLGQARLARGDHKQAYAAYERALLVSAQSPGAIASRRGLVELSKVASSSPAAIGFAALSPVTITEHLRAVVHHSGDVADLLAYAHDVATGSHPQNAGVLYDVLACTGTSVTEQQLPGMLAADTSYRGVVGQGARAMISDPDIAALAPIVASITEAAALLWPDNEDALTRRGLAGAIRATSTPNNPALSMFPKIAAALATGAAILYQREDVIGDAQVLCTATPIIVLSERLMKGHLSLSEARTVIARAVEMTRPEHIAIIGLTPADAARTLAAVIRLFGPPALRDAGNALIEDQDVQRVFDETVRGALSVKLRTRFEQLLKTMEPSAFDIAAYTAAIHRTADRAALLLGGSAATIVANHGYDGQIAELTKLVGHPHWQATRTELLGG